MPPLPLPLPTATAAAVLASLCLTAPWALASASSTQPAPQPASVASTPPATQAAAQAPSGLLELFDLALLNDARWRGAQAAAAAQQERLPQARAQLLPQVGLSVSRQHNDLERTQSDFRGQPVTTQERFYGQNQTLSLRQPLLRPALHANLRQARALVEEADATLEREQHSLGERVLLHYLEALLALEQQRLLQAQLELTRNQLQAAQRAFELGSGIRTDIDEARARLDLLLAQALQARLQVELTRRQLQALTSSALGTLQAPPVAALPRQRPDPLELAHWIERAHSHNPELLALQARLQAARHEIERAQGGRWPTLDATIQYTQSASESLTSPHARHTNRMIGLQFNLPLYTGGAISSQVRQAVAQHTQAQEALEAARRDLALRVQREHDAVVQGSERISAHEQALRSAETMVTSNRRSFEAGVRTVLDVLNAEQARQQAELDLLNAFYEHTLASFRLHSLAGAEPRSALAALQASWAGAAAQPR